MDNVELLGENLLDDEPQYVRVKCWNCTHGMADTYNDTVTCWICGGSGSIKKKKETK